MRGHGAVVVGASLPAAVFRSVYTEVNARLQAQAMALGGPVAYLDPEEAKRAEASVAGTIARPLGALEEESAGEVGGRAGGERGSISPCTPAEAARGGASAGARGTP